MTTVGGGVGVCLSMGLIASDNKYYALYVYVNLLHITIQYH